MISNNTRLLFAPPGSPYVPPSKAPPRPNPPQPVQLRNPT